jgi:hypothetical protein
MNRNPENPDNAENPDTGHGDRVDEVLAAWAQAPLLEPPAALLERWHGALAVLPPVGPDGAGCGSESVGSGRHRVVPPASVRASGRVLAARRWGRGGARVAVALLGAAASVAVVCAGPGPRSAPGAPLPVPGAVSTLHSGADGAALDPARTRTCAHALGLDGRVVLAARQVLRRGEPAVRLILATGRPGAVETVIATVDCSRRLAPR